MAKGRKTEPAQAVRYIEEVERLVALGSSIDRACRTVGIGKRSFYRWRTEYAGINVSAAHRLRETERENAQLKRLVAEMAVKIQALEDVVRGKP